MSQLEADARGFQLTRVRACAGRLSARSRDRSAGPRAASMPVGAVSRGTLTSVGTCLLLFLVLLGASTASAQSGGALPFYGEPTVLSATPSVVRVFARDFTRDGIPDIAVVSGGYPTPGPITVYPGLGNGTFGAGLATPTGGEGGYPYLGDFNGDGTPDFAFLEGSDSPTLQSASNSATGTGRSPPTRPPERCRMKPQRR